MSSTSLLIIAVVVVGAVAIGFGLIGALRGPQAAPGSTELVPASGGQNIQLSQVSPAEAKPGRQIYNVSTAGSGPKIVEAVIDGFDAPAGELQHMGVRVQFTESVESVIVTLSGDQGSVDHVLQLTEGSKTDGRWEGSWPVSGTHRTVYQAAIRASASSLESKVTLSFK